MSRRDSSDLRLFAEAIEDLSLEVRRQGLLLNRVVSALERLDPDFDFGRVSFAPLSEPPDLTPRVSFGVSPRSSAELGPNPEPRLGLSSQTSLPLAAAAAASSDRQVRREPASSSQAPSGTLGFSPARPSGDSGSNPESRLGLRPSPPVTAPSISAAAPAAPRTAFQSAPSPSQGITEEERRAIAREIGGFFARALAGQFRGQSGRSKNPLQSRLYVVVRGASGEDFRPPILCRTLAEVRGYCEEEGQLRDSIFCGFPALWEAKLACESAGLPLPAYRSDVRGQ